MAECKCLYFCYECGPFNLSCECLAVGASLHQPFKNMNHSRVLTESWLSNLFHIILDSKTKHLIFFVAGEFPHKVFYGASLRAGRLTSEWTCWVKAYLYSEVRRNSCSQFLYSCLIRVVPLELVFIFNTDTGFLLPLIVAIKKLFFTVAYCSIPGSCIRVYMLEFQCCTAVRFMARVCLIIIYSSQVCLLACFSALQHVHTKQYMSSSTVTRLYIWDALLFKQVDYIMGWLRGIVPAGIVLLVSSMRQALLMFHTNSNLLFGARHLLCVCVCVTVNCKQKTPPITHTLYI